MSLLGYAAAMLIGFTLGLLGGGGSILTVPVLVYLLGINPVLATAYSLFIVGTTALLGSLQYMRKQQVHYKAALLFAVPSFIAVYLTRRYLIPAIPEVVLQWGDWQLTKGASLMLLFALIMLASAFSMIGGKKAADPDKAVSLPPGKYPLIFAEGAGVGVLTGLVGAGGGFLIVPALVLLVRLPMKIAVGTSLLIIAVKSLIGFLGDVAHQQIDWPFLFLFTSLSAVGIALGSYTSRIISGQRLKQGFGWFVLLMAIYIFIKELIP